MKANEVNSQAVMFVKKFGLETAYDLWQGSFPFYENNMCILSGSVCTLNSEFMFNLLDIKSLIESHELVASRGGLDAAKHELIALQKHLNNTFGWVTIITSEKIDRLNQAILDVESCQ